MSKSIKHKDEYYSCCNCGKSLQHENAIGIIHGASVMFAYCYECSKPQLMSKKIWSGRDE